MFASPNDSDYLPPHKVTHLMDPAGHAPPYSYTVGLGKRPGRAYELVTTGLPYRLAYVVVTRAAEQLVCDGLDPADGTELDDVLNGHVVRLRPAQDTTRFLGMALDTPAWQVLTPDRGGRFPGDEHYIEQPGPYAQPLL
jgi:hypothetical protein